MGGQLRARTEHHALCGALQQVALDTAHDGATHHGDEKERDGTARRPLLPHPVEDLAGQQRGGQRQQRPERSQATNDNEGPPVRPQVGQQGAQPDPLLHVRDVSPRDGQAVQDSPRTACQRRRPDTVRKPNSGNGAPCHRSRVGAAPAREPSAGGHDDHAEQEQHLERPADHLQRGPGGAGLPAADHDRDRAPSTHTRKSADSADSADDRFSDPSAFFRTDPAHT